MTEEEEQIRKEGVTLATREELVLALLAMMDVDYEQHEQTWLRERQISAAAAVLFPEEEE